MLERLFTRREIDPVAKRKFELAAGWRFGLAFGIVLVVTAWGWDARESANASVEYSWVKLPLAMVTILPLCMMAGGIAMRDERTRIKMLVWGLFGAATGFIAIHLPFEPTSIVISYLDPATRETPIFPFVPGAQERVGGMMLFGAVAGVATAWIERLALVWAWDRSSSTHRMTLSAWATLWIAAPVAFSLGVLYDGGANLPFRDPARVTNRVIQVALTTPLDLDLTTLGIFETLDYAATTTVRDQFSAKYTQHIADFDRRALASIWVDAEFDNGFLWRCQITANGTNLRRCYDLTATYRDWVKQFLQTSRIRCEDCNLRIEPDALAWQQKNALGAPQRVEMDHRSGGIVLVRAIYAARTVECRLVGSDPVNLRECK